MSLPPDRIKRIMHDNTPVGVLDPRYKWQGNTTIEKLKFENNSWDTGSAITHVVQTKDPLGRLLDGAENFRHAALILARICETRLYNFYNDIEEQKLVTLFRKLRKIITTCSRDREEGWPIRTTRFMIVRGGPMSDRVLEIWGGKPSKQDKQVGRFPA